MKYKVLGNNNYFDILKTIFNNRGIENIDSFLNINSSCLCDYSKLNNLYEAYQKYNYHIEQNSNICIIVDCDVDGYCSAAMVYNHIKSINPKLNITYCMHSGKQHGIADVIGLIPKDTNLLIVPDAGTNDVDSCKELSEKGIDVIILDHHNIKKTNDYAIVVNCKDGYYDNPDLCGAGVVFKLLELFDDENWTNYSEKYRDLAGVATLADMVDLKNPENRYIVKGIYNINNRFLNHLINNIYQFPTQKYTDNDFIMKVIPIMNGCIRMGDIEDKIALFEAFAEIKPDRVFSRTYRNKTIEENIFQRALRISNNAKHRQDSSVNKAIPQILSTISFDDNVLACDLGNVKIDGIEKLTGLIANKLANKYNKPCIAFKYNELEEKYKGSGRNYNNSTIDSFIGFLNITNCFSLLEGHDNAFGLAFDNLEKIEQNVKKLDVPKEKIDIVDFEIPYEDMDLAIIKELNDCSNKLGRGFMPVKVAIKDLFCDDFKVMGSNSTNWKITSEEGIEYLKFGVPDNDELLNIYNENWEIPKNIRINLIGKPQMSFYNSIITPQIIIEKYEIVEN